MSRLIASTMTHSTYDLAGALRKLKEAGFTKVELCSAGKLAPHFDVHNASVDSVAHTVRTVRESGMQVHCLNIGEGECTINQMEYVYALAESLGAGIVTYMCGWPKEGVPYLDRLREATEFNSKLADLGEKYGVICAIEAPHKLSIASNTEEVDRYWSMQDPRVKMTFDTAHLTYCGEDMLALARRYVGRIVHSHLRDAEKGNSLLRYGQGVVNFEEFFKILNEGGYKGYFSMEYPSNSAEDAVDKLQESVKFLSKFDI